MNESDYYRLANDYLTTIADRLEEKDSDGDLDVELQDGVLTIVLESGKTFVVSRHAASKQIWLSSPVSGGLHFSYNGKDWALADGRILNHVLSTELKTLAHIDIAFP